MKKVMSSIALLSMLCLSNACKNLCDCETPLQSEESCIVQKLEDWKKKTYALSIYEIYPPSGGTWFWLEDSYADGGEEILDDDCRVICITDIEGEVSNECQQYVFDYPRKKVWSK